MYTSISEYLKVKKAEASATNESVSRPKKDNNLKVNREIKKLGSLVERLGYCHFILNKGLINESSSLSSINDAFRKEFGVINYFKTDEQFNAYYSSTLKTMKRFVEEAEAEGECRNEDDEECENKDGKENEGLGDFISGVKTYDLANIVLDPKSAETYKQRPQIVQQAEKNVIDNLKCTPEEAKQIVIAFFNFAKGSIPIPSKWNVELIKSTDGDKEKINPNGKGLFTGSNMF